MATTAGALSLLSIQGTTAQLSSAAATGGTAPYTYQWYRSTVSGFTPGAGNILAGQTGLSITDSSLIPGTTYYWKVVATDSGAVASTSAQVSGVTSFLTVSQNQFQLATIAGKLDLVNMGDSISVQVDVSQATPIAPGQALKAVASAGGIPKVVACTANSDVCIGFVNYDIKSQGFNAGDKCEMASSDAVIYLYATTAIPRYSRVTLDMSSPCAVGVLVASSGAQIVGYALDQAAAAGTLIRVKLTCPTFSVA